MITRHYKRLIKMSSGYVCWKLQPCITASNIASLIENGTRFVLLVTSKVTRSIPNTWSRDIQGPASQSTSLNETTDA